MPDIQNADVSDVKQGPAVSSETAGGKAAAKKEATPANFDSLSKGKNPTDVQNLDFILDIPLEVSVEIGRTKMMVNELLQLGQGSVVELDKYAGEPVEIFVNEKLIAMGEVVVVNEKFGVRLTDIISPMDRVKQLK